MIFAVHEEDKRVDDSLVFFNLRWNYIAVAEQTWSKKINNVIWSDHFMTDGNITINSENMAVTNLSGDSTDFLLNQLAILRCMISLLLTWATNKTISNLRLNFNWNTKHKIKFSNSKCFFFYHKFNSLKELFINYYIISCSKKYKLLK